MSHRELDRIQVIRAVVEKRLRQREAADQLGVGVRQIKRLAQRFRAEGPSGLVSGKRGKASNRSLASTVREKALALIREHYPDYGPTLAQETLKDMHQLKLSVETLRQWMIQEELWQARVRPQVKVHQRRPRRPRVGELVQIDGSPHDWFEGRGPRCTLLVFIDDATSRLQALRFVEAETTEAYMRVLRDYLDQHGRPVSLYSDKHSIFRINRADCDGERTQFTRAVETLDIACIHANTPQAKGRVERANRTLQDRLVKELRRRGISDMERGNAFLPAYVEAFNARFAKDPSDPEDAHRPVLHDERELDLIFSLHIGRTLSTNLTCQYANREYQVQARDRKYTLRGARVTVCHSFDGSVTLVYQGRELAYRVYEDGQQPVPIVDEKTVGQAVDEVQAEQARRPRWKPAVDHPWRRMKFGSSTNRVA